jgi:tetratricopeptide (TPR) repeat protein
LGRLNGKTSPSGGPSGLVTGRFSGRIRVSLGLLSLLLLGAAVAQAQLSQPQPPEPEIEGIADPCARGEDLYRAADFLGARKALLECLDTNGPAVEALLPLVVMATREGRLSEAERFGAEAVALAPDDPEARYWYGRALLRLERPREARTQWEKGLALDLGHFGLLEGLARLSMVEGETAKAYQLLDQMLRQGMNEPWLHRLMADITAGRGLWPQSLAHMRQLMLLQPPTLEDLLVASELSIMAGEKDAAIKFGRQAVTLQPGAASFGGLGEAFFAINEMDSALVYLRQAVELDPSQEQHRFNLANALEVTGATEEAHGHFQAYLEVQPDDAVGHFNFGVHLDKLGRSSEALFHVSRAIEIEPSMLTARVVRIQILEDLRRWDDALQEIEDLLQAGAQTSPELESWRRRLETARDEEYGAVREGKVHILHMVVASQEVLDQVLAALEKGEDFAQLTVRFSSGPAAARGGDVGWIKPADMVAPLGSAIEVLGENEISPPIESRGLYHLFKRIP